MPGKAGGWDRQTPHELLLQEKILVLLSGKKDIAAGGKSQERPRQRTMPRSQPTRHVLIASEGLGLPPHLPVTSAAGIPPRSQLGPRRWQVPQHGWPGELGRSSHQGLCGKGRLPSSPRAQLGPAGSMGTARALALHAQQLSYSSDALPKNVR